MDKEYDNWKERQKYRIGRNEINEKVRKEMLEKKNIYIQILRNSFIQKTVSIILFLSGK